MTKFRTFLPFVISAVGLFLIIWNRFRGPFFWPANGTIDFIEYWSAFQISVAGDNPYLPANQARIQSTLGNLGDPIMMWNPPWLLLILYPVLSLPFLSAAKLWLFTALGLTILSIRLVYLSIPKESRCISPLSLVLIASFLPLIEVISFGQVGVLFLLSLSLALYLLRQDRTFLAGVALALLSVKPHLFYLLFILIGLWTIRQRKFWIVGGLLSGFLILLAPTFLWAPHTLNAWIDSMSDKSLLVGATDVRSWVGTNLVGILRVTLAPLIGDSLAYQFRWLIPGATAISLLIFYIRSQKTLNIADSLYWAVPLSLFTSPFGWSFDQVGALACVAALVLDRRFAPSSTTMISIILVSLTTIVCQGYIIRWQHQLFWYLPLVFVVLLLPTFKVRSK